MAVKQHIVLRFVHKVESFLSKAPKWAISNSPVRVAERSRSNAQAYISICYESPEWA
jgi:hypothetical protein